MSHPMFDRMTRRMEILQRQIDEQRRLGGGDTPATPPAAKPPAPAGILTQSNGKPKPLPNPAAVLTDEDVIAATLPATAPPDGLRPIECHVDMAWMQDATVFICWAGQQILEIMRAPGVTLESARAQRKAAWAAMQQHIQDVCIRMPAPRVVINPIHVVDAAAYAAAAALALAPRSVVEKAMRMPAPELCCDGTPAAPRPPTSPGASHAEEA